MGLFHDVSELLNVEVVDESFRLQLCFLVELVVGVAVLLVQAFDDHLLHVVLVGLQRLRLQLLERGRRPHIVVVSVGVVAARCYLHCTVPLPTH